MTRFEFITSVEQVIPYFFPEMEKKQLINCVFIEFQKNKLMFSIIFYKDSFDLSQFNSKLAQFNSFLELDGIIPIDNLIRHKFDDERNTETYFYRIPLHLAQGFTD